jgi:hypothetical protein
MAGGPAAAHPAPAPHVDVTPPAGAAAALPAPAGSTRAGALRRSDDPFAHERPGAAAAAAAKARAVRAPTRAAGAKAPVAGAPASAAAAPVRRADVPAAKPAAPAASQPPAAPAPAPVRVVPAATPAPVATPAPAPQRTFAVHRVDVRMSPLGHYRAVEADLERYRSLPGAGHPVATFVGRLEDAAAAAFVVPGHVVEGGDCHPTRARCSVVAVRAGRHAVIRVGPDEAWQLDVVAVHTRRVGTRPAERVSAAGGCALRALGVSATALAATGVRLAGPPFDAAAACPRP